MHARFALWKTRPLFPSLKGWWGKQKERATIGSRARGGMHIQKNDMSFSRAPIHARIWPLELSPQTGVISVKITRRADILGIWRISSLDLTLSCSAHNFSRWFMQDQGRCYRLDPRQPEHFWRDSFKYTMYSENATDFTEQRWHWLQVCDGKIRFKDKNE